MGSGLRPALIEWNRQMGTGESSALLSGTIFPQCHRERCAPLVIGMHFSGDYSCCPLSWLLLLSWLPSYATDSIRDINGDGLYWYWQLICQWVFPLFEPQTGRNSRSTGRQPQSDSAGMLHMGMAAGSSGCFFRQGWLCTGSWKNGWTGNPARRSVETRIPARRGVETRITAMGSAVTRNPTRNRARIQMVKPGVYLNCLKKNLTSQNRFLGEFGERF